MSHDTGFGIPMDVRRPLEARGVCVARADVTRLEGLEELLRA